MIPVLSVLILICVLILWCHYRIANRKYFKLVENFASIGPEYPLIGHLLMFLWKSPHDKIRTLCSKALKMQRTAKLWVFSKCVIILNTPEDVQTVLNSPYCLQKGSPYKVLAGTGSGLITSAPSKWKPHRRLLNTPFTFQNIIKNIPTLNAIARKLVHDLEPYCDQGEISLIDKIGFRLTDISLTVLLDYSFDSATLKKCFHSIEASLEEMGKRLIKFYSAIIVIFIEKLFKIVPRDQQLLYGLVDVLDVAFVAGKQKYMHSIEADAMQCTTDEELRNRPDGFLKRLYRMAFHNRMTEIELEENIGTFVIAGTDTSTTAIGNVLLCLAMHPGIQEKLYVQLKDVMADSNELDCHAIFKLDYLDRVVKESFRFLPLVPIVIRKAEKNIQLDDAVIPAGCDILIPIDNLHRRKSIWGSTVDKFDPDHFLPANCAKRHPCSFIPFSYGPRNCIGYKYAQISVRIVIAHLIRNYKFETNMKLENLLFNYGISVKPENGYRVFVSKRC